MRKGYREVPLFVSDFVLLANLFVCHKWLFLLSYPDEEKQSFSEESNLSVLSTTQLRFAGVLDHPSRAAILTVSFTSLATRSEKKGRWKLSHPPYRGYFHFLPHTKGETDFLTHINSSLRSEDTPRDVTKNGNTHFRFATREIELC